MSSFESTLARMKDLYTYGKELNENSKAPVYTLEHSAKAADGKTYGIIRECNKYYIKSAPKGKERIAHTFQRWLLACIVIAYLVTSTFTFILQNRIVKIETQEVFTAAIGDVEADIKGKSDSQLLAIAHQVKQEYENDKNVIK